MNTYQVLVVEHDPDMRSLYRRLLKGEPGVSVRMVEDAETALSLLTTQPFDVLLAEWHLPDTPGTELIRTVRRQYPDVKTVLISVDAEVRYAARRVKADGWLLKSDIYRLHAYLVALFTAEER